MYTKRDEVRDTNAANERINERNLQAAYEMQGISNSFTEKMWNMTNAYNDPSAEAQRWRNAGFSPSMMMGQTPAAVAASGSSGTTPSAIPMQSSGSSLLEDISKTLGYISSMASIQDLSADAHLKTSQAQGNEIANQFSSEMYRRTLNKLTADTNNAYASSDWYGAQIADNNFTRPYRLQQMQNEVRQMDIQEKILGIQLQMNQKQLPWIDKQYRYQLAEIMQNIEESKAREQDYMSSKKYKDAQTEVAKQEKESKRLDNLLKNFTEKQRKLIKQYIVGEHHAKTSFTVPQGGLRYIYDHHSE